MLSQHVALLSPCSVLTFRLLLSPRLFIDRFGYRLHFIPASSVFFIVVFCLMVSKRSDASAPNCLLTPVVLQGFTQTPGIAL